jgi:hypothetical protein
MAEIKRLEDESGADLREILEKEPRLAGARHASGRCSPPSVGLMLPTACTWPIFA